MRLRPLAALLCALAACEEKPPPPEPLRPPPPRAEHKPEPAAPAQAAPRARSLQSCAWGDMRPGDRVEYQRVAKGELTPLPGGGLALEVVARKGDVAWVKVSWSSPEVLPSTAYPREFLIPFQTGAGAPAAPRAAQPQGYKFAQPAQLTVGGTPLAGLDVALDAEEAPLKPGQLRPRHRYRPQAPDHLYQAEPVGCLYLGGGLLAVRRAESVGLVATAVAAGSGAAETPPALPVRFAGAWYRLEGGARPGLVRVDLSAASGVLARREQRYQPMQHPPTDAPSRDLAVQVEGQWYTPSSPPEVERLELARLGELLLRGAPPPAGHWAPELDEPSLHPLPGATALAAPTVAQPSAQAEPSDCSWQAPRLGLKVRYSARDVRFNEPTRYVAVEFVAREGATTWVRVSTPDAPRRPDTLESDFLIPFADGASEPAGVDPQAFSRPRELEGHRCDDGLSLAPGVSGCVARPAGCLFPLDGLVAASSKVSVKEAPDAVHVQPAASLKPGWELALVELSVGSGTASDLPELPRRFTGDWYREVQDGGPRRIRRLTLSARGGRLHRRTQDYLLTRGVAPPGGLTLGAVAFAPTGKPEEAELTLRELVVAVALGGWLGDWLTDGPGARYQPLAH